MCLRSIDVSTSGAGVVREFLTSCSTDPHSQVSKIGAHFVQGVGSHPKLVFEIVDIVNGNPQEVGCRVKPDARSWICLGQIGGSVLDVVDCVVGDRTESCI